MKAVPRALFALVFAMHSTGCYEWIDIRPSELPKLQPPPESSAEAHARNATLERPDGSLLEIGRNADVRVTARGFEREFESPVHAEQVGDDLSIRAGNSGKMTVPIRDLRRVEVAKLDVSSTVVAIVAPIVFASLATGIIVYVANSDSF